MANFFIRARLHTLECILTTDFGDDEPFMWNFFIVADGRTLRQDPANPGRFLSSLTVVAKPGHHGNLGVKKITRGERIPIPEDIGAFGAGLRPISLSAPVAGQTRQVWIPGRIVALGAVLDEDSTSHAVSNAIHAAVADHIQSRVNQFFSGLDISPVIAGSAGQGVAAARTAVDTFLADQIAVFQQQMRGELTDLAIEIGLAEAAKDPLSAPFTIVVNALDHDELVGTGSATFAEDQLIAGSRRLDRTVDVGPNEVAPPWYRIQASADATIAFYPPDIETSSRTGTPVPGDTETYTPTESWVCVPPGPIEYWRVFIPEWHDILVTYPFCAYRYSIAGKPLTGTAGSVKFNNSVSIPEFDGGGYPFDGTRHEDRTVTVQYSHQVDALRPQLSHLILENDPADGSHGFTVKIEAVLPDGSVVHVSDEYVYFDGQRIGFPPGFIEGIEECLEPFTSNKYSKTKHVGLKELWGPHGRELRYQRIQELIDEHASIRAVAPERLAFVRDVVAKAFNRREG